MQTQLKDKGNSLLELTVELGKDELVNYIRGAERQFGQDIAIDGFRKGKAPRELLDKHLDKDKVLQVALQSALQDSLAKVIDESGLDVIQTKDLKIQENSADRLRYSVALVVFPKVQIPDLGVFKASRQEVTVQDKEVQEAADVIRNWRATFAAKEGPVQQGDRVEVDFKTSMDGKPLDGGESTNHPLIVGGKGFIPGFEEQLVGLKKGETKTFSLTAPDDYYQKNLAGRKLDFEVKVNEVQQVRLPELDDAFVKNVGKFDGVEQFLTNIREGIRQEKEEKERQRVRLEILDRIIGAASIQPPELLVEEHLNRMVSNFDADLHAKGMELGMYLAHVGKTQDELRRDWRRDAEKQAKIELVLRSVAKQNGIRVSETEVDAALNQMVQALVSRGQTDPEKLDLQEMRHHIAERLLNEKALEHIERTYSV